MTTFLRHQFLLALAGVLALVAGAQGQQSFSPHIGYVYPAGGRQGTSFQIKVGGQRLQNVTNIYFTGGGIRAVIADYSRPMTGQEANELRQKLKELQDKRAGGGTGTGQVWTEADRAMVMEIRRKLAKFQRKPANPAIAETVTVKITIATNAEPGEREIRLGTPQALSQPLVFCVGQLPEFIKPAPSADAENPEGGLKRNNAIEKAVAPVQSHVMLPCVVNGQILPGGVDLYRFQARQGQRLVIAASARELIPYLADAVPGWFQAVLSLYDAQGHEVACADHFQFHPDPVLYYDVPKDGEYIFQIRDSIYRGREDFIYRITAGQLPFVTGMFPLGGPAGEQTKVKLTGWNLPDVSLTEDAGDLKPGTYPLTARSKDMVFDPRPFAVDALPECVSEKGNDTRATAQSVTLPIIINGRIEQPGQWNIFRFHGKAGEEIVAEVTARRLDSPLDSVISLVDASGVQLAFNDDYEDKGAGLQTQYADSYLRTTLPKTGVYYLSLGDAQHAGGPEYSYRLRLSELRPDFELRVTPSSLTVRGGMSASLTVYALRRDGFSNEITLRLKGAPAGYALSGAVVPANQDKVQCTLTTPHLADETLIKVALEGYSQAGEEKIVRPVIPSENMMQAFAYWHLVPSQELDVLVLNRARLRFTLAILDPTPLKIPAGGSAGLRIKTPAQAFANTMRLELNDPPEGITLAEVVPGEGETKLVLHSDASKIKPGATGSLVVNIVAKMGKQKAKPGGKARMNQNSVVLGVLPAIRYEIVAPALAAK
jgi:hypothetical protein